jgi:hypothetical protein
MSCVVRQLHRFSALAISGCAALALSVAAHAQTFSITNVTKNSASKASYPSMVVDANSNLNLVWVDSVSGIMFARSSTTTAGTTLGTAVPVTGSNGPALPAFQPQIAVDPTDTTVVAITWAALDPASPPAGPATYDVYAVRLTNKAGVWSETPATPAIVSPAGLPLADSPRLAWDNFGRVNIVWGQNAVWITQTADGSTFTPPANLSATTPPTTINTGGPRAAVDASGEVVVVWTDTANEGAPGTYCTNPPNPPPDNATIGGNFWVNETVPVDALYTFNSSNTRNLSATDWVPPAGTPTADRFAHGFFGCSSDNLRLFTDKSGHVNLLWSDELPIEDVLTSKPVSGDALTNFAFPINLATVPAASPQVAVDTSDGNNIFYVVWSGGPTGGTGVNDTTNSQGIFFSRSEDGGNNFTAAVNIAPPSAVAPAYPQVAIDSNGNVYVAWEQVDQSQPLSANDTFNVFFARSADRGDTFPTVSEVSANSSALCIPATPVQTTPNSTLCGSVQIGVDANSNPDMAWVNQASSGAAIADIDFATTNLQPPASDFSISSTQLSETAQPSQTANFTITAAGTGGFSGSIALACTNFFVTAEASGQQPTTSLIPTLTCSAPTVSVPGSSTVSVVVPSDILSNAVFAQLSFEIAGTSTAGTTHKITVTVNIGTGPGSVTPVSQSITGVGNSATFTVNVNPADFTGSLTFSCLDADTGGPLPAWLGCSFNPNPPPAQSFTTQLTLTEVSTPTSSSLTSPPSPFAVPGFGSGFRIASAWAMALAGLAMMLTMFTLGRRQRLSAAVVLRGFLVMTLTIVLATALVSCGGSTSTPSTTTTSTGGTSGTGGTGSTGGSGGSGSGGSGGSGSSGGSGGGSGTGGGTVTPVQIHVSVLVQSSTNTPTVNLGTVTLTAQ